MSRIFVTLFIVVVTCATVSASPVTVPPDLPLGAQYRLVFVTSAERDAVSPNIDDYNAFVTTVAQSSPGLFVLGTTWRVIGSTSTVDARDNTNTDPNVATGVPIYNVAGLRMADNYADLWDRELYTPVGFDETGANSPATFVASGTFPEGTRGTPFVIGSALPVFGRIHSRGAEWVTSNFGPPDQPFHFYAMSGVLTVPEPSTLALITIGLVSSLSAFLVRWSKPH